MTEYKNPITEQVIKELEEQLGYEVRLTKSRLEAMKESEVKMQALEEAIKVIKSKNIDLSIVTTGCIEYEEKNPKKPWWKQIWNQ